MERFMNGLTDKDWGWWPFVFLRPAQNQYMTTGHVAKMSLFFGPTYGLLSYVLLGMERKDHLEVSSALGFIVLFTVLFFVAYRVSFAYFWNRRAQRMQKQDAA